MLEIGPGFGPLTQELCLRAGRVTAIEGLDTTLRPRAGRDRGRVRQPHHIHFADAMKMDLPALVQAEFPRPDARRLCQPAVLYHVSGPDAPAGEPLLLRRDRHGAEEVARRICAAPGTADYSAFSILCQYHAAPELLFDVPASCFIPQPKVTSAVVCLRTRPAPADIRDETLFFRTVRASFAQRRKTLVNGLASGFPQLTKAELTDVLAACGLPANVRGETRSASRASPPCPMPSEKGCRVPVVRCRGGGMPLPAQCCRSVPASGKNAPTNCVCSGAH